MSSLLKINKLNKKYGITIKIMTITEKWSSSGPVCMMINSLKISLK